MLMDQSSWDDTLVGVRPPRPSTGDAVSFQSSRDKHSKRSPAEASVMEGRPISTRPQTCRTYDCRIFPAAGLGMDDDEGLIARQARRWQFSFPT